MFQDIYIQIGQAENLVQLAIGYSREVRPTYDAFPHSLARLEATMIAAPTRWIKWRWNVRFGS